MNAETEPLQRVVTADEIMRAALSEIANLRSQVAAVEAVLANPRSFVRDDLRRALATPETDQPEGRS